MKTTYLRLAILMGIFLGCSLIICFYLVNIIDRKSKLLDQHEKKAALYPVDDRPLPTDDRPKPAAIQEYVKGIDISHFQGTINWDLVAQDSIAFVFMKATGFKYLHSGPLEVDPTYYNNWREASKNKLICGAYHFFHPNHDAVEQANFFIQTVRTNYRNKNTLPPVLDVEYQPLSPKDPIRSDRTITVQEYANRVLTWLEVVEDSLGRTPIIYTNLYVGDKYLSDSTFQQYPLYMAYPVSTYQHNSPWLPKAWDHYFFWQYSTKHKIAGIKTHVDQDVFNGNKQELETFIELY